jgi:hypothetical protein
MVVTFLEVKIIFFKKKKQIHTMTKYYEAILPPPNFILDWVEGGGDDYSQAGDKLFFLKKRQ